MTVGVHCVAGLYHQSTSSSIDSFEEYVKTFARDYVPGTPEYKFREQLFHQRLIQIKKHNALPGAKWTAGINHLVDRTDEEFSRLHGWRRSHGPSAQAGDVSLASQEQSIELPDSVNWQDLTAVKNPKDQGYCGSCWAMATSTMLEGRYEVAKKSFRSFSAQQLVDCVENPLSCGGTGGCEGATVELAMDYIMAKGIREESAVPYTGFDGACPDEDSYSLFGMSSDANVVTVQNYKTLASNQAKPLMEALVDGPVAISAAASDWMLYMNGIFDGCSMDAVVNHAVVLVGYGTENGQNYWTVQNSWGKYWGENGFIRVLRADSIEEDDAHCGTDHAPEDGIECKPYPDSVEVCGMCGILYDSVIANF
eukprot:CAMPEP_0170575866 /NCGR_PEP_ID=MMETSP0224-20130122/4091_1 /TAXON_ID=285029 /ORGANISM="Togula jolla, Strain CCCM 725" /LENGTH=365 /DNA_ID=CAMNT_0010898677 /DNA_START=100 /DNA_END=1197 /DNA_ORIENTATION=-